MMTEQQNSHNISIQLQDDASNISQIQVNQCDDQQLTEELYEIARRIAESDRNSQAYRQTKKNKSIELENLKQNQYQKHKQYERIVSRIDAKKNQIKNYCHDDLEQNHLQIEDSGVMNTVSRFNKKNTQKFQEATIKITNLQRQQRQLHASNVQNTKDNQKLEKKINILQAQFEILVKENKHKAGILGKLKKQKESKEEKLQQNEEKIIQLEQICEKTKNKAEKLENQLREELQIEKQLDEAIRQKQYQLEMRNRQREETQRKNQQNKRQITKLVNTGKLIENQIEEKMKQSQKLEQLYDSMRAKIGQLEQKQRKFQQVAARRRNILTNLKKLTIKADKEQQSIKKIKAEVDQRANSQTQQQANFSSSS